MRSRGHTDLKCIHSHFCVEPRHTDHDVYNISLFHFYQEKGAITRCRTIPAQSNHCFQIYIELTCPHSCIRCPALKLSLILNDKKCIISLANSKGQGKTPSNMHYLLSFNSRTSATVTFLAFRPTESRRLV